MGGCTGGESRGRTVLVVLGGHGWEGKVSSAAASGQLPGGFRRPAPASSSCRLPLLLLLLPVAERVEEAAQLLGGGHGLGGTSGGHPGGRGRGGGRLSGG